MNIVCIAWGSLLWRPGPLRLASGWHPGGPRLPLEFARDSDDSDELALVLCPGAPRMPTYWAYLDTADLEEARALLRAREKITPERPDWVGSIPAAGGGAAPGGEADGGGVAGSAEIIGAWLRARRIDAAVWTALPPKFAGVDGRAPTAGEAVALLAGLEGDTRANAERYLRRTPAHIDTPYRRLIEARLGWRPLRDAHVTRSA